jgi:hypothetical protein
MSSRSRRAVALAAAAGLLSATFQPTEAAAATGPYGVCAQAGQNRHVGCVTVTVGRTDDGPAIYVRPLHNADPLVAETPYTDVHLPEPMQGNPHTNGSACGTCY